MNPETVSLLLTTWVLVCLLGGLATFAIGALRWRGAPPAPEATPAAVEPQPEPARESPAAPEPTTVEPARPVAAPAPDLRSRLAKTREAFAGRLDALLRGRAELDTALLEELEGVLFGADIGVRTAEDLLEVARGAGSAKEIRARLEERALEILEGVADARPAEAGSAPRVVMIVGVNGSGKTTTLAKLAALWMGEGSRVLLAASDTFRAAAIDQLGVWAERVGAELVRGEPGGDPAAVAFDAVRAAVARGADVVGIDTAGRLQTQAGLMDELSKIARVVAKEIPGAPHEVLLVLDANTGQNAIRQAHEFARAVDVSGIVLAKLDGTAKGGVVLGIAQEVGIPVRYVGLGEGVGDLVPFESEPFVRALFAAHGVGEA